MVRTLHCRQVIHGHAAMMTGSALRHSIWRRGIRPAFGTCLKLFRSIRFAARMSVHNILLPVVHVQEGSQRTYWTAPILPIWPIYTHTYQRHVVDWLQFPNCSLQSSVQLNSVHPVHCENGNPHSQRKSYGMNSTRASVLLSESAERVRFYGCDK